MAFDWRNYRCDTAYDELFDASGAPRPAARSLVEYLHSLSPQDLADRRLAADLAIKVMGITFTVYSEGKMLDRAWPFDIIPRVIPKREWEKTEKGLKQRVTALNHFIQDLYGKQQIIKDGVFPAEILAESVNFRKQCVGVKPKHGIWAHICGSDLVRDGDGTLYVLEDNLRVPSGVSYMLENRGVIKRIWPELFQTTNILPVDDYAAQLYDTLVAISPRPGDAPNIVLLTPGIYNSAYFEHAYLAQQMGVELVEGPDLFVRDGYVWMRTTSGPKRVDVIYRRIDDAYLDPLAFNPDSVLGVPGILAVYRAGRVAITNAVGTGVGDDKSIYPYVPDMIRFYLTEEPILQNVPTWLLRDPDDLKYVLDHLPELVVKEVHGSGGYGMLIGPTSSKAEIEAYRQRILANPSEFIAQPTLSLSTCPTFVESGVAPRHLDLRPFVLSGKEVVMVPGGLTRVALKEGSLVVNSSQGGGTKDTWIVDDAVLAAVKSPQVLAASSLNSRSTT